MPTVAELAQQELSRRYSLQGRTQVAPRVQTMQNARPTVRSALSNLMRDAVDATGLEGGYRQGLLNAAGGVETAVDFLPVIGDALAVEDASRAYGQGDMVGAGINMMGVVPIIGDVAAKGARSALRVRPPSDNITNVRNANFQYPKTIGDETLNINSITGNLRVDQQEQTRINRLADQISSPEGYISRIIVDQNNNVIEGQHRLEALRQLGAKEVPVYKIEELADTMPVRKMEEAINTAGKIHSDHVNQIMQYSLENIAEEGVQGARNFDLGNFQKYYDAALNAVEDGAAKGTKTARSALRGIDAYHGSPHEFEQFSMDKIGTGEGVQAYGDGLYFAEQKGVAEGYRDDLSRGKLIGGTLASGNLINEIPYDRSGNIDANRLNRVIKDREYALSGRDSYESELREWERYEAEFGSEAGPMPDYLASKGSWDAEIAKETEKLKMLKKVQLDPSSVSEVEGQLYNVNLNVDPNELLDWDAPLSQQNEKVRQLAAERLNLPEASSRSKQAYIDEKMGMSGGEFYNRLVSDLGEAGAASSAFNNANIKGIRYFDGMSRKQSEGTRNYVMFDDSLIDTKRVNDQLTPSWMNPEARMQRAQDLGFDTSRPLYHSTNSSFDSFKVPEGGFLKYGKGVYTTPKPQYADRYIRENRDLESAYKEGANVMPLYARGKIATEQDWEAARQKMMSEGVSPAGYNPEQAEIQRRLKEQGFDGLNMFGDEIIIFDPKNIRSTNAEFDPTKADSADLLSSVGATSSLRGIV